MLANRIRQTGGLTIPLTGLQMWLKADQGVTLDGNGRVSQWSDLSGVGRHVTQATAGQRPLFLTSAQNGRPGIQFVASRSDVLESLTSTNIDNCSIFTVIRIDSIDITEDVPIAIGFGNNLNRCRFLYRPGTNGYTNNIGFALWGNSDFRTGTIPWDSGNYHTVGAVQTTNSVTLYRDSLSETGSFGSSALTTDQNYWGIGASSITGFGNYYTNCTMSEVIIYNRAVSTNERTLIMNYLKARWATP